jgi:glycosyltransferase involved in cell wall biosynthesis
MTHASILIPVFDRVELLQESLESLHVNTAYPHEIIIYDDGSNVATKRYLGEVIEKGLASYVVMTPYRWNRGNCFATDQMFSLSSGDYIAKMDGDEQYSPGWLGRAIKAMELWPEIGQLSLHQFYRIHNRYEENESLTYGDWDKYVLREFEKEGVKIAVVWCSPGGQFIIRRKDWEKAGPWYHIPPSQEFFGFRSNLTPMFRLLPGWERFGLLPVKDKEGHWMRYHDTPWLAVLDPPVVSTAWGQAKTMMKIAGKTVKTTPPLFAKQYMREGINVRGQFGPMRGYNRGRDLARDGPIT